MEGMTIRDMRREAVRALTEYRRMKGRLQALAAQRAGLPEEDLRATARLRRRNGSLTRPPARSSSRSRRHITSIR